MVLTGLLLRERTWSDLAGLAIRRRDASSVALAVDCSVGWRWDSTQSTPRTRSAPRGERDGPTERIIRLGPLAMALPAAHGLVGVLAAGR